MAMFCKTCNEYHEHDPGPRGDGGCWCTYMRHDVIQVDEVAGPTREQRLADNVIRLMKGTNAQPR